MSESRAELLQRIADLEAELRTANRLYIEKDSDLRIANRLYNEKVAEMAKLRKDYDKQADVIKRYAEMIAGEKTASVSVFERSQGKKVRGRPPKIDESRRFIIRQMRKEGATVREIAAREKISISTVSLICSEIQ